MLATGQINGDYTNFQMTKSCVHTWLWCDSPANEMLFTRHRLR